MELFGKTGETNCNVSVVSLILPTKNKCVSSLYLWAIDKVMLCSLCLPCCLEFCGGAWLQCGFVGRKEDVIIEDNYKFPVFSLPEKKFSVIFLVVFLPAYVFMQKELFRCLSSIWWSSLISLFLEKKQQQVVRSPTLLLHVHYLKLV